MGGGKYQDINNGEVRHVLSAVDLDAGTKTLTETDFLPHGIHRKPTDTNCLAVFEKIGPGACEYDLATGEVVRMIEPSSGRWFYGHGAYSIDGDVLYSTETVLATGDGLIAVRDSDTLESIGEFPTYGKEPHECKLLDDGRTMVITNGGGDLNGDNPCITYVDIASEKLLEKVRLTNAELNTGHLAINPAGSLVVVSAPRAGLSTAAQGGISIGSPGMTLHTVTKPAAVTRRMQGEALSVVVHSAANVAAVTHPDGDMVTFWSLEDRSLLKVIKLPKARGIELTLDERAFIVSYGTTASLVRIPVATLEPDSASVIDASFITGSHIYNWSRAMSELFYPGPFS